MNRISLCMIVKNEEETLSRCLESAKPLVDEIIIVDTGSTDNTKAIASAFTENIYDFPWQNDFAAARNFAFAKATMEYQMWLDADDVIDPEQLQKMLKLKKNMDYDRTDVVMFRYSIAFDQYNQPTHSYYRERWIKRSLQLQWKGAVHEAITPVGNVIRNEAYVSHRKVKASDVNRNLRIYEQMKKKNMPFSPRDTFYYARELMFHNRLDDAIRTFTSFLDKGDGWIENNIEACYNLNQCYKKRKLPVPALQALYRSFTYDLPRPEICCELGYHFLSTKQNRAAAFWFESAIKNAKFVKQSGAFQLTDYHGFIPAMELCVCYDRMGERKKAIAYHKKAQKIKPEDPAVLHNEAYFNKAEA